MPETGSQVVPSGQQMLQLHRREAGQNSTQVPPTHCLPHWLQGGLQVCVSQAPLTQVEPEAQLPWHLPPQPSPVPHGTLVHCGVQMHLPCTHMKGDGQAAVHVPPQPSVAPPHLPVQLGTQQAPLMQFWPFGQGAVQVPPQPSDAPPHLPVQVGVQHWLLKQTLVVSLHVPPQD
jgi:hypothetical protein